MKNKNKKNNKINKLNDDKTIDKVRRSDKIELGIALHYMKRCGHNNS
jgi:hypothetical protein